MQGLTVWLPSVACCMAIQGFWLAALVILQPRSQTPDLQDLHRFSSRSVTRLTQDERKPRV
jgi:hypothetical protein